MLYIKKKRKKKRQNMLEIGIILNSLKLKFM